MPTPSHRATKSAAAQLLGVEARRAAAHADAVSEALRVAKKVFKRARKLAKAAKKAAKQARKKAEHASRRKDEAPPRKRKVQPRKRKVQPRKRKVQPRGPKLSPRKSPQPRTTVQVAASTDGRPAGMTPGPDSTLRKEGEQESGE